MTSRLEIGMKVGTHRSAVIHRMRTDVAIGQAELGPRVLRNVDQMLGSVSVWPFLRVSGMPEETYRNLIAGARAELREPRYKLYFKVYLLQTV